MKRVELPWLLLAPLSQSTVSGLMAELLESPDTPVSPAREKKMGFNN